MKDEDKWRETLKKTRWMWFKVVNENNDWMSTVDKKTGYGNIDKDDFVKLLESHGFRVRSAKQSSSTTNSLRCFLITL